MIKAAMQIFTTSLGITFAGIYGIHGKAGMLQSAKQDLGIFDKEDAHACKEPASAAPASATEPADLIVT